MKNLAYSRQYLLSNQEVNLDKNWKNCRLQKIGSPFTLHVHPDLEYFQAANDAFELILLGYLLDPDNPSESTSGLLNRLIKSGSFDEVIRATYSLNGRYAIIYNDAASVKVFNDAIGLREVFFTNNNKVIACGSTSNIIAAYHGIAKDTGKEINDYFMSPELNCKGHVWFGSGTIFSHVRHLLPNHYVDLLENKVVRFWPVGPKVPTSLDVAAKRMASILTGSYDAAVNRFTLHQSLTSGWDTKLLLAAGKKHAQKIHFYFNSGFKSDIGIRDSVDYTVAKQIAKDYGLHLEIVDSHDEMVDSDFETAYFNNNIMARSVLLKVFYNRYKNGYANTTNTSGTTGNEILRVVNLIHRKLSSGEQMAKLYCYDKYPYVINEIQQWLDESKYVEKYQYSLFDLFYWEQLVGNWGALGASEQDIVREEFRPFNNRELITLYTSLKDNQRYTDCPAGHVAVIKLLWKELLDYPMDIAQYRLKMMLRTLGLEQLFNKMYHRMKKLKKMIAN